MTLSLARIPGCTMMWYLTADEVVRFGFEEPTRSVLSEALMAAYAETRDESIRAMFKTSPSSVIGKKRDAGHVITARSLEVS